MKEPQPPLLLIIQHELFTIIIFIRSFIAPSFSKFPVTDSWIVLSSVAIPSVWAERRFEYPQWQ
jgi:hypothetical protein